MKQQLSNFNNVFSGKKIIVTGHTGFKGTWLIVWLLMLGAKIKGIALNPSTEPSHYKKLKISKKIIDKRFSILDRNKLTKEIVEYKPDFVFHLAAQAIVKESYVSPLSTWDTNLTGTINVINALTKLNNKCISIIVTSDKCYKNKEIIRGYRENDELGGYDPYSASKGAAELAIQSYIKSFFNNNRKVLIAIGRAGNVIGGGDWSKDRILPDCVKSWSRGKEVVMRNPESTRPWQHVLEPLSGYLTLAQNLTINHKLHGEAFNFGPKERLSRNVLSLVKEMSIYWQNVKWKIVKDKKIQEAGLLRLNCEKAKNLLKWKSNLNFSQTVKLTAMWYKSFYDNNLNVEHLTQQQIISFVNQAKKNNLIWSK